MRNRRKIRLARPIAIFLVAALGIFLFDVYLRTEFDPSPGSLPALTPRRALDFDEAKRMLNQISDEYEKSRGSVPYDFIFLAQGRELIGDVEGSRRSLDKATEIVNKMVDPKKVGPLLSLAHFRFSLGDRPSALRIHQDALKILSREPFRKFEDNELSSLACSLAILDDQEGSQKAVNRIFELADSAPPPRPGQVSQKDELEHCGLETLARLGEFDRAFKLVEDSVSPAMTLTEKQHVRGRAFESIARGAGSTSFNIAALPYSKTEKQKRASAEALRTILRETGSFPFEDDCSPSELAVSLSEVGEYEDALRVARTIGQGKTRFPPVYLDDPRIGVFTRIAMAQAKAGRRDEARKTRAERLKIIRSTGTQQMIAEAEFEVKLESKDFKGASAAIESADRGDRARMLVELADSLEDAGNLDQAHSMLELALKDLRYEFNHPPLAKINDRPIGMVTWFKSLIIRSGPRPSEQQRYSKMGPNGVPIVEPGDPDVFSKNRCLDKIAFVRARAGDFKTARKLPTARIHPTFSEQIFQAIAALQVERGDPEEALRWAIGLDDAQERSQALWGVIVGVVRKRNPEARKHPRFTLELP